MPARADIKRELACVGSYVTVRTSGWIWGPKRQEPLETQARLRPATSCGSESVGLCRGSRLFAGLTAALHGRSSQPMMIASGVSHNVCSALKSIRDRSLRLSSSTPNIFIRSRKFYGDLHVSVQSITKSSWPRFSEQYPAASPLLRLV